MPARLNHEYTLVRSSIMLPPAMIRDLKAHSRRYSISVSSIARLAIRAYLDAQKNLRPPRR